MTSDEVEEKALAHWEWIENLDKESGRIPTPREKYLFTTGFVHGFKHGVAWEESEHLEKEKGYGLHSRKRH